MQPRLSALLVLGVLFVFVGTRGRADVPTPAEPFWTATPTPDYGVVELLAAYDTPTLIRYASHVYDKDTNNSVNPTVQDVDRAWGFPYPAPATTPPHYATERNPPAFENSNYQAQPGHLLWRMSGGTTPTMNVTDVNIHDKWRQVQTRQGTDTANDTTAGNFAAFEAAFVVKAQAGQIKFIVNLPNGQPAQGAACYIQNVFAGNTDAVGVFISGPLSPAGYSCKATAGMLNTLPPITANVVKGNVPAMATVTLTLHM